jgi:hypothetical protein
VTAAPGVSRRHFLLGSLAVSTAGAATLGLAGAMSTPAAATPATPMTTAWMLATDHWSSPRGNPARTHCRCNACVAHGAHKLFATRSAAEDPTGRAHRGCLCEPQPLQLPTAVWDRLFDRRAVVDRRHADVAAALADVPTRPATGSAPPGPLGSIAGASGPLAASEAAVASTTAPTATGSSVASGSPAAQAAGSGAAGSGAAQPVLRRTAAPAPSGRPDSVAPPSDRQASNGHAPAGAATLMPLSLIGTAAVVGALVWWRRRGDDEPPARATAGDAAGSPGGDGLC